MIGHPESESDGEERQMSDVSEWLNGDDQQQCCFHGVAPAICQQQSGDCEYGECGEDEACRSSVEQSGPFGDFRPWCTEGNGIPAWQCGSVGVDKERAGCGQAECCAGDERPPGHRPVQQAVLQKVQGDERDEDTDPRKDSAMGICPDDQQRHSQPQPSKSVWGTGGEFEQPEQGGEQNEAEQLRANLPVFSETGGCGQQAGCRCQPREASQLQSPGDEVEQGQSEEAFADHQTVASEPALTAGDGQFEEVFVINPGVIGGCEGVCGSLRERAAGDPVLTVLDVSPEVCIDGAPGQQQCE